MHWPLAGALCSLAEELSELQPENEALLRMLFSATVLPTHGPECIFLMIGKLVA